MIAPVEGRGNRWLSPLFKRTGAAVDPAALASGLI
jgi:hypothetical protein